MNANEEALHAALVELERCARHDARGGMLTEPVQAWIEACRAEVE